MSKSEIIKILDEISDEYRDRPVHLQEVAGGYRFQVAAEMSPWVARLFDERPPKYSRAFLETLSIIAYRQPVTRGEIERIRGVSVSSNIIRTLRERNWIRVIGHKEVPGKPALYATTKEFLDYFNLKSLSDLPELFEFEELNISQEENESEHGEDEESEIHESVETAETAES